MKPPFKSRPLTWGIPPARGVVPQPGDSILSGSPADDIAADSAEAKMVAGSIASVSFSVNYTAGNINSPFPAAVRVATHGFTVPVGIVSVMLSSSIINATTDGLIGVFVAKDVGSNIDLANNVDLLVEHLCNAGLGHSMRSGISYADDFAPKFGSGEKIAIYIANGGTGLASNKASAIVTVRYFTL